MTYMTFPKSLAFGIEKTFNFDSDASFVLIMLRNEVFFQPPPPRPNSRV